MVASRWQKRYADERPASTKNRSGNAGKTFETQVRHAFEALPSVWVKRFTDSLTLRPGKDGRMEQYHAPSPPDLIAVLPGAALLIECKAQRIDLDRGDPMTTPIPLSRLPQHQWAELEAFERVGPRCRGVVGVLFYNGLLGKQRVYRAWLVPITYWAEYQRVRRRGSIPMVHLAGDLPGYELEWIPSRGGWQLHAALTRLLGS